MSVEPMSEALPTFATRAGVPDEPPASPDWLLTEAAIIRAAARDSLSSQRQSELSQYFTPIWVARLMASFLRNECGGRTHVLDPGAGVGTLFSVLAADALYRIAPEGLKITAFELDRTLKPFLERSRNSVLNAFGAHGIECDVSLRFEDFADSASRAGLGDLFGPLATYDAAILNPPYQKLPSGSDLRRRLNALGICAPNLYAAFLGLALLAIKPGGLVVAIVPRSFCNGTYFTRFRHYLLDTAAIRRIHLFHARNRAFGQDAVLQENVILVLERTTEQRGESVLLSFSEGSEDDAIWTRRVQASEVIHPGDPDQFIHLPHDEWSGRLSAAMIQLPCELDDLELQVSTGPVVAFRAQEYLTTTDDPRSTAPLLYAQNFRALRPDWPISGKKPQALLINSDTKGALIPSGWYVVTKRFTSKEEPRRVVASVLDPEFAPSEHVALENHLNYFHRQGSPLGRDEALGLATYLNSTLVDQYFRQFSGHTQVNATDLRKLRYPAREGLVELGATLDHPLCGSTADEAVKRHCKELSRMPGPNKAQERVDEALAILEQLGLPREQQNERSALTLLALLGLKPGDSWEQADSPLMGVTPIMAWAETHYDRAYAPNTRETFRRFTLHQFVDAGLVVPNPDKPDRTGNSPNYCYQIEPEALKALRTLGRSEWEAALADYLEKRPMLRAQYAQRREMERIPLAIQKGVEITLSPGGQNELVREVMEEFCPRFVPGGEPLYIGDAGQKWAHFNEELVAELGMAIDQHGKMPDLVVFDRERSWLILVEAVTSHGPVSPKRMRELKELFAGVDVGLVFVTAFMDRATFLKYLSEIAWETEVWIADSPGHLIHFDGERFLGPHDV